jgi:hypothetical protein
MPGMNSQTPQPGSKVVVFEVVGVVGVVGVVAVVAVVVVTPGVVCACAGTTTERNTGFVHDDGRKIAATPAMPVALSMRRRVAPRSCELFSLFMISPIRINHGN